MAVKWSHVESDTFSVQNGVRQGGNLSPLLFNVYIDDLLHEVRRSGIGCHVGSCAVNIIAYADDIVLLSPTRTGLVRLVEKCELFASTRDVCFNTLKSVCMVFHPQKPYGAKHLGTAKPACVPLNGSFMSWVDEFKYLGHVLVPNLSDSADMRRVKRVLYYGANAISAKLAYADKRILVELFKLFCSNMFGCELWNPYDNRKAFKELCVAYHSSLKKLVKMPRSSRNHDLCLALELLPCHMNVARKQLTFWLRLSGSDNIIIRALLAGDVGKYGLLAKCQMQIRHEYDLIPMDLSTVSPSDIRNVFVSKP